MLRVGWRGGWGYGLGIGWVHMQSVSAGELLTVSRELASPRRGSLSPVSEATNARTSRMQKISKNS